MAFTRSPVRSRSGPPISALKSRTSASSSAASSLYDRPSGEVRAGGPVKQHGRPVHRIGSPQAARPQRRICLDDSVAVVALYRRRTSGARAVGDTARTATEPGRTRQHVQERQCVSDWARKRTSASLKPSTNGSRTRLPASASPPCFLRARRRAALVPSDSPADWKSCPRPR